MARRTRWLALGLVGMTTVVGLCYFIIANRATPTRDKSPDLGSASPASTAPAPRVPGRIAEENAKRIVPGMSLAEVERILGPARDETGGGFLPLYPPGSGLVITKDGPLYGDMYWVSKEVAITIRVNNKTKCVRQVWFYQPWEA